MSISDDETPQKERDRKKLQSITVGMASMVEHKAMLKEAGIGFALLLFDFEVPGNIAYASSGARDDMMRALRELLGKMEIEAASEIANATRANRGS